MIIKHLLSSFNGVFNVNRQLQRVQVSMNINMGTFLDMRTCMVVLIAKLGADGKLQLRT